MMERVFIWLKKIWPVLASMGGAVVMLLAFFIPSIQEQWDRYESRKVIQQYEQIGDDLFEEGRFDMAEQSYAKAFSLSDDKRLDIEVKRLSAKVNRVSADPVWGSTLPDDLQDIDFQLLLHLQSGKENEKHRVPILNSYGIFLSSSGRIKEAEDAFEEAVRIDSTDVVAYVNMGNLLDQLGKKREAEKAYLKATALEPENAMAHYNLGLLLEEEGRLEEARAELTRAVALDPDDKDARIQLDIVMKRIQK
jgi:tetratricopeptide (TPR) repeat protein